MKPEEVKYLFTVNEHGVDEVILGSPKLLSCFLTILLCDGTAGFGADGKKTEA